MSSLDKARAQMTIIVNKHPIEAFEFPGGECQIRLLFQEISATTHITAHLYHSNDIMRLLLTVDAIRRINPQTNIELNIPYFPYARQDRVCNPGEALSVAVMAKLINDLNCQKVIVTDPHSDVTPALLNNVSIISMAEIIVASEMKIFIQEKNLTLISPDAGAEKKVRIVSQLLAKNAIQTNVISASKSRDTLTGHITATHIHDDVVGKNIIILDDICDGGRTFIELARVLKENGANQIFLYVTHGIFSHGLDILKQHFEHVFCYHTLLAEQKIDTTFLTVLKY